LNPTKDIADLSKGTKQKVAVVQAFMHEPELLILDEPTSGLDPIIQHEFEEIIEAERQRGTTVILSSHVMSEVERLADRVAIITKGHLAVTQSIAGLKEHVSRSLELEFPSPQDPHVFTDLDGVTNVQVHRNTVICQVVGSENQLLGLAVSLGVTSIRTHDPSLDEIFLDIVEDHQ
jgi:ABC-2 type transport system ATP-binding protein